MTPIDIEAIAARWADYPASQAKRDIEALLAEVRQLKLDARCTKCGTEQVFIAHWPARHGEMSVTEMLETRMLRASEHGKRCAGVQVIPMSKMESR